MSVSRTSILIVGGGLAGVAVAWQLWQRQVPFVVVDPGRPDTTSRVAAGLVTPITGQRLRVSWRLEELLPEAHAFYRQVEAALGETFFHRSPMVRLFHNARELKFWETRRHEADIRHWADVSSPESRVDAAVYHNELGSFGQKDAAWLDTVAYLDCSREYFISRQCWLQDEVHEADLELVPEGVRWRGALYAAVILCRGADERSGSRFFPWLHWDCARGALVNVKADISEQRLVQRGAWIQPRGEGTFRAGSTYEFDFSRPIEDSVDEVRVKLLGLLKAPFEITGAKLGIRPIVKRKQLILGRHPVHEKLFILNGLGSKGVLRAPFFSRTLVDHLLASQPIEAEVDVRANG